MLVGALIAIIGAALPAPAFSAASYMGQIKAADSFVGTTWCFSRDDGQNGWWFASIYGWYCFAAQTYQADGKYFVRYGLYNYHVKGFFPRDDEYGKWKAYG